MCSLNSQQQLVVRATEGPLLIVAGAGSGITAVLIPRFSRLLEHNFPFEKNLSVTFTVPRAAAPFQERRGANSEDNAV